jgi:uncharacterized protein (TIGR02246 family)
MQSMKPQSMKLLIRIFIVHLLALGLFGFGWVRPAIATTTISETCQIPTEAEVAHLFDRWNDSLLTKNPDQVLANYAADAVLLPTLSNQVRMTPAEIRDYFVSFLAKKPIGKVVQRRIKTECNAAIDTGLYTFTLQTPDGVMDFPARYTFDYEYRDGNWLIVSHHSSGMPEH